MPADSDVHPQDERTLCYAYRPGDEKSAQVDKEAIPTLLGEGVHIWVDISEPSEDDTRWLGEVFGFHELALVDLLNNSVRPKQESYEDVLFTVLNAVNLNEGEDQLDTINLNAFLTEQFIVSTHCKPLRTIRDTFSSMVRKRDPLSRGTGYIYYKLLDGVVNRYLDITDEVDEHLTELEHEIFEAPTPQIQEKIFNEKRRLAYLRRSITPKRDALRDLFTMISHKLGRKSEYSLEMCWTMSCASQMISNPTVS